MPVQMSPAYRQGMITCVIQYTLDPHQIEDFEKYATAWPPIIERCGGRLVGYYLPKEGENNLAFALIDFDSSPTTSATARSSQPIRRRRRTSRGE